MLGCDNGSFAAQCASSGCMDRCVCVCLYILYLTQSLFLSLSLSLSADISEILRKEPDTVRSTVTHSVRLINVRKWRELAEVLEEVRVHLKTSSRYESLDPIPCIQKWLEGVFQQTHNESKFGRNNIERHFEGLSLSLTELFRFRCVCRGMCGCGC